MTEQKSNKDDRCKAFEVMEQRLKSLEMTIKANQRQISSLKDENQSMRSQVLQYREHIASFKVDNDSLKYEMAQLRDELFIVNAFAVQTIQTQQNQLNQADGDMDKNKTVNQRKRNEEKRKNEKRN